MKKHQLSVYRPRGIITDDLWDNFFSGPFMTPVVDSANVELYEEDDKVIAKFEAPGFKSENFDISFEDNVLTVSASAEQEKEEEDKKKKYYYKEISKQSFTRAISVPVRVKSEEIEASYKDGILSVSMKKAEEAMPKKNSIKAN